MNIKIKVDCTDHFGLFCPNCGKILKITSVETNHISGDKCTQIGGKCKNCVFKGERKIYWNDDGDFLS